MLKSGKGSHTFASGRQPVLRRHQGGGKNPGFSSGRALRADARNVPSDVAEVPVSCVGFSGQRPNRTSITIIGSAGRKACTTGSRQPVRPPYGQRIAIAQLVQTARSWHRLACCREPAHTRQALVRLAEGPGPVPPSIHARSVIMLSHDTAVLIQGRGFRVSCMSFLVHCMCFACPPSPSSCSTIRCVAKKPDGLFDPVIAENCRRLRRRPGLGLTIAGAGACVE